MIKDFFIIVYGIIYSMLMKLFSQSRMYKSDTIRLCSYFNYNKENLSVYYYLSNCNNTQLNSSCAFPLLLFSSRSLQVRQEIAQEFENVKDISSTLASFKADNVRPSYSILDEPFRREEPTRDPDVWPPPTPVEHRYEKGTFV